MALTSDFLKNQLAGRDQAADIDSELIAPTFRPILTLLVTVGNFDHDDWRARFVPALAAVDDAFSGRESNAADQTAEAEEIAALVAEGDAWVKVARAHVVQAARLKHPTAPRLLHHIERVEGRIDTFRDGRPALHRLLTTLQQNQVSAPLRFAADYFERGQRIVERLIANRAELIAAQAGITVQADILRAHMAILADLCEEVNDAREVVMAVTGKELPGFDLRLIRAAAASRPAREEDEGDDNAAGGGDAGTGPATGL
jgi:hypothetical protein